MNKCLEHIIVDVLGKHENYERRNQNHDNNRKEHFVSHFHLDTSSSRVKSLLLSFISSNERSLIMILYKTIQHAHFIFHVYYFGISMKRFFLIKSSPNNSFQSWSNMSVSLQTIIISSRWQMVIVPNVFFRQVFFPSG